MKGPNEENQTNSNSSIPSELIEQINNLKKQNANSTFELLKTRKVIQDFKLKLQELEKRIDQLGSDDKVESIDQNTILKLREMQRFLE